MDRDPRIVGKVLGRALSGKGAHVETGGVFAGLTWRAAGTQPGGVPHSAFQLLNHLIYWQEWVVKWLEGQTPPVPKHAAGGWPGEVAPANAADWQRAVRRFRSGLRTLDRWSREDLLVRRQGKSRLEMIQAIASHNSYHVGEVAIVRQMAGAWPPPKGGLTW